MAKLGAVIQYWKGLVIKTGKGSTDRPPKESLMKIQKQNTKIEQKMN